MGIFFVPTNFGDMDKHAIVIFTTCSLMEGQDMKGKRKWIECHMEFSQKHS